MKLAISYLLGAWVLFTFSGCAGLLDGLREESAAIDREEEKDRPDGAKSEEPTTYQAKTLRGLSANNVQSYDPPVQRGYGRKLASFGDQDDGASAPASRNTAAAAAPEYHRATRADFVDSSPNENSLWDGQGQGNYLFSQNRQNQPGDLVTGDVEKELKREIQYQLWMTLPPEQRKLKRNPASVAGAPGAPGAADGKKPADPNAKPAAADAGKSPDQKNRDAAEEAAKTNLASGGKDDDIVRMEVAESLGNGLVRVVGQKRVIYRGVARVVEVMALVNNKDIDDSGHVKSSSFLDMKTQVIQ